MPEEPRPPVDPAQPDEGAEWTDESGFEELESEPEASVDEASVDEMPADEWGRASLDWEDDIVEPSEDLPDAATTQEALAWLKPTWQRLQAIWGRLIAGLKNRIPAAANLSDTAISTILIGVLGGLLVLLNSVRQPSMAEERSPISATPPAPTAAAPTEPTSTTPEPLSPTEEIVDVERIAQIQAQLTDSSIHHASRLIDSVQADFTENRLILTCNDDWFRLSAYDQDLLANQLMNQSVDLSFDELELQTTDGQLIARNPVIGDAMIIFLRTKPPAVEPPERPRFRITIDR